jgi:hypothetical protein
MLPKISRKLLLASAATLSCQVVRYASQGVEGKPGEKLVRVLGKVRTVRRRLEFGGRRQVSAWSCDVSGRNTKEASTVPSSGRLQLSPTNIFGFDICQGRKTNSSRNARPAVLSLEKPETALSMINGLPQKATSSDIEVCDTLCMAPMTELICHPELARLRGCLCPSFKTRKTRALTETVKRLTRALIIVGEDDSGKRLWQLVDAIVTGDIGPIFAPGTFAYRLFRSEPWLHRVSQFLLFYGQEPEQG